MPERFHEAKRLFLVSGPDVGGPLTDDLLADADGQEPCPVHANWQNKYGPGQA